MIASNQSNSSGYLETTKRVPTLGRADLPESEGRATLTQELAVAKPNKPPSAAPLNRVVFSGPGKIENRKRNYGPSKSGCLMESPQGCSKSYYVAGEWLCLPTFFSARIARGVHPDSAHCRRIWLWRGNDEQFWPASGLWMTTRKTQARMLKGFLSKRAPHSKRAEVIQCRYGGDIWKAWC